MYANSEANDDESMNSDDDAPRSDKKTKAKSRDAWNGLQVGAMRHFSLTQEGKKKIDLEEVVLLDTGSTFHGMCNEELIAGVKKSEDAIGMKTNMGTRLIDKKGTVPGLDNKIWFDPKSVSNIWSFHKMAKKYPTYYDSTKEDAFHIHTNKGIVKFKASDEGLYYYKFPNNYKKVVK